MPAVPVHHTATVDETWDGPAAVAAMPSEKATLTYCHAWYSDDGDRDEKGTYKFPHAKNQGGPANLAACRNGLARVENSSIPEGDKAGVRKHLQAHLDDAEKKDDRVRSVPSALRNVAWPKGVVRAHSGMSPVTGAVKADGERPRPWLIRDAADDGGTAEILLYDEIGGWGIYADDFARDLSRINARNITVRINSPGGDVFDGIAIMNSLMAHPAQVTIRVDGLAASIASVICLAGDRVVMGHSSQMMIHNASTMVWGEATDMRQTADLLDQISGTIAQAYSDRSGTPVEEWQARMDAESWLTAQDCVRMGLADEVAALPEREEPPAGIDPDPDNHATARPAAVMPMRPAAVLTGGTPRDVVTGPAGQPDAGAPAAAPTDASTAGDGAPNAVDAAGDAPYGEPTDAPVPAEGIDPALIGQVMAWALAVDQHVDRLIAECAAALGVDNPDVDTDTPPPPLPGGITGLAYALGTLTAVDTIVDGAQKILAAAIGIPNPDSDEDDDDQDGPPSPLIVPGMTDDASTTPPAAPAAPVDPLLALFGEPHDTPGTGASGHDEWADFTNELFTAAADPVLAALEGASL